MTSSLSRASFSPLLVAVVFLAMPAGWRTRRAVWRLLMVLTALSVSWLMLGLSDH